MAVAKIPVRGTLEEQPLPTVLRALLREKRDGCLTVSRGAITRRLFLRGGMITYGSSNQAGDRLGEILILQGKLSKADHKRYWAESQGKNRLLGITLLVNGRITLSDLYQAITAQVVTILDRLQKWRTGEYEFEEGCAPAPGTVLLRIPLAHYLKADAVKKPAKKAAAKPRARGKAPAAAPEAAAPEAAVAPAAPATGAADGDEEEELLVLDVASPAEVADPALAQEQERLGEISFMVQELRQRVGQEPHLLLGVPAGAGRTFVQEEYHRIAKVLHPDRLPKCCPPELALEAEDVLREVTSASLALEEGHRRQALETAPASATPATAATAASVRPLVPEEEQARRFFAQGREWIAKRNYWQAADALRQAVRIRPKEATYRQYLGLALMQTKRLHEAEEHLVEATRLEPNNPSHYVNLGRIYRGGRLFKKAREAFERALRIDPRDAHAREELSDLPDELPPVRKPEGGILKKLFGKG